MRGQFDQHKKKRALPRTPQAGKPQIATLLAGP
jgi:hypothetical protein